MFPAQWPVLVVGNSAGSKWMSDGLLQRAASKERHMHIVQGENHMQLYDVPKYVDEAAAVLSTFYKKLLMKTDLGATGHAAAERARAFAEHLIETSTRA